VTQPASRKTPPAKPRQRDPFRYGVRYVRRTLANGRTARVATPMPREALLHPLDEDYPLEASAHDDDCTYLKDVLGVRVPRTGLVLSDCRVDWEVPGIKPHGPDISVFDKVRRRRNWKTFYVQKEKARILLVIEITSPGDRNNDLKIKVDEYYRAGVPLYAIADAREKKGVRTLTIIGYRRGPTRYERIDLDTQGRLLLEPLGVLLGAEGERICCYDARTGQKIGDYEAVVKERDAVEEEKRKVEERNRQLEAEIRRLRGEH
jgi:colicin import membrane protein